MLTIEHTMTLELMDKLSALEGELQDKAMYVNDAELLQHIDDIIAYHHKIDDQRANTPFWAKEAELLKEREQLEWECGDAKTLQDAIICGANMTILEDENDTHKIGYLREDDGTFEICDEEYEEKCANGLSLCDIPVEFYSLDRDEDGYTTAIFKKVNEEK